MWKFDNYGDKVAAIDEYGHSLTYSEMSKKCKDFQLAIGRRCLIFCICNNSLGSLLGYVSCIKSNVVPLLLSHETDKELVFDLIKQYRPSFIWQSDNDIIRQDMYYTGFSLYGYKLYKTEYQESPALFQQLALLLTTSGSTGSPKLVRQSYKNIIENTKSIIQYLELASDEKVITTLPMNYTYGISIINTHLEVGATLLLTDKSLVQKEFWGFFKEQQATSFGGVPYTYEILMKLRFFNMKLPNLRMMTQAGGKLDPELHHEFASYAAQKKIAFFVMYGASEATARMSYLPPSRSIEKKGSIGIAIPKGRFEIIDGDGSVIKKSGVVGEIVYYGDNVTLGYAICAEDLCKGDEWKGRLETGDMGYFDEEGYYYITGRKKRFLKVFGNRFGLDEAEKIIKQKFSYLDIACAGVDDAVYIFVEGDNVILDEIRYYISEVTKINIAALKIKSLDELPRNNAGKIMYAELEKYYD